MARLADPLREYALSCELLGEPCGPLLDIADAIDAEHERRMERCRHETRRAFARYLRAVTVDYERGIKRVRKESR